MDEKIEPKSNKIEIPKADFYFYHVRSDTGNLSENREILYSVSMADCPWCGERNEDVGETGHLFVCNCCEKKFEVGELADNKSFG